MGFGFPRCTKLFMLTILYDRSTTRLPKLKSLKVPVYAVCFIHLTSLPRPGCTGVHRGTAGTHRGPYWNFEIRKWPDRIHQWPQWILTIIPTPVNVLGIRKNFLWASVNFQPLSSSDQGLLSNPSFTLVTQCCTPWPKLNPSDSTMMHPGDSIDSLSTPVTRCCTPMTPECTPTEFSTLAWERGPFFYWCSDISACKGIYFVLPNSYKKNVII